MEQVSSVCLDTLKFTIHTTLLKIIHTNVYVFVLNFLIVKMLLNNYRIN